MKMTTYKKQDLFSVNYSLVDYDSASDVIIEHAKQNKSFGMTALAVHGLIESVWDKDLNRLVNKIDLVVPDGQPIVWALNFFYRTKLKSRVIGRIITYHVLKKADKAGLKVYLYGSTRDTLEKFEQYINKEFPNIEICGIHADRFREATEEEDQEDIQKINGSNANLVLVGRGCPRQEVWVANHIGSVHAPMMAVGAAFDFLAGNSVIAPSWMQRNGLEWLFRLMQEPSRLWKRYLFTNSYFIFLFVRQVFGLRPSRGISS